MSPVPADRDYPGERDADLDAAFAEIVAGWDDDPARPVPPWPVAEDLAGGPLSGEQSGEQLPEPPSERSEPFSEQAAEQTRLDRDRRTRDDLGASAQPPAGLAAPGPRDWELAAHPEEHYQPPEPPPLPRGDLAGQLAWAGLLLGPAFLLFAALFWRDVGQLWIAVAAAAFVGGFVALVVRLPATRGDDDDGAVV